MHFDLILNYPEIIDTYFHTNGFFTRILNFESADEELVDNRYRQYGILEASIMQLFSFLQILIKL